jgi:hypothetical protein
MKNKVAQWLFVLAVAMGFLRPERVLGQPASCTCARFNDSKDMGCHKLPGGPGAAPSGANNAGGNKADCPTCPPGPEIAGGDGPNGVTPVGDLAMPRWWVDEPYINLHVSDTPLLYRTSSGQPMYFSFYYKQRYAMPWADQVPDIYDSVTDQSRIFEDPYVYQMRSFADTNFWFNGMTNAAWTHNWMMSIVYWDTVWESDYDSHPTFRPNFAPFSKEYEAELFNPDGSVSYFMSNSLSQTLQSLSENSFASGS